MILTNEQRALVNQIEDLKRGFRYYTEEIENNPQDNYIQAEFKRRRDAVKSQIQELRAKLKKALH